MYIVNLGTETSDSRFRRGSGPGHDQLEEGRPAHAGLGRRRL